MNVVQPVTGEKEENGAIQTKNMGISSLHNLLLEKGMTGISVLGGFAHSIVLYDTALIIRAWSHTIAQPCSRGNVQLDVTSEVLMNHASIPRKS